MIARLPSARCYVAPTEAAAGDWSPRACRLSRKIGTLAAFRSLRERKEGGLASHKFGEAKVGCRARFLEIAEVPGTRRTSPLNQPIG
jgi:hypothetical protein